MVDLGFRVGEGLIILLYRKCSKYIVSRLTGSDVNCDDVTGSD